MEVSAITNIQIKSKIQEKTVEFPEGRIKVKPEGASDINEQVKKTQEEIIQNIEEMLKFFEQNTSVKFQYDKSINKIIIQVINGGNNEIIKQIPPEEMVRFLKAFNEIIGLLIDKEI